MLEQINQDIKQAMKAKEKEKLEALRYLKSMLLENKTSTKPVEEMDVVVRHYKKLKDSLEAYPSDHPQREKITLELTFIADYLPQQLSQGEVEQMITAIIAQLDAPQMGAVMKELSPQIKGRFEGKLASQLVQKALAK